MPIIDTTNPSRRRSRKPASAVPGASGAKAVANVHIPHDVIGRATGGLSDGIYIMGVDGDCLAPEIRDKHWALVAPGMAIARGDIVVLWFKSRPDKPLIKRVILPPPSNWQKWHGGECVPLVMVEQLSPPRRYTVDCDRLLAIHRVAMTFEQGAYERSELRHER